MVSVVGFDTVHYILHVWENSRFSILRKLGGLHAVHHEFLDRQMRIQPQHTWQNILHHVIPEFSTTVVGIILLGFVFGWLPSLIVLGIRAVMFFFYLVQKGQDFTHYERSRINGKRSLYFVGPHYHAMHHVYPRQYYSSFVNVFDLVWGTNCQINERRFLITGGETAFGEALASRLRALGGVVTVAPLPSAPSQLNATEILIVAEQDAQKTSEIIKRFEEVGKTRLVPPEVWAMHAYRASNDLTFRRILVRRGFNAQKAAGAALFWLRRGFSFVPASVWP